MQSAYVQAGDAVAVGTDTDAVGAAAGATPSAGGRSLYVTGVTSRLRSVLETSPPMSTTASGL
jgi:hypothetical protein